MKNYWWKILGVVLVAYTIIGGLLFNVPRLNILNETIRNLHFHVPMWFGMIVMLLVSVVYSIKYLTNGSEKNDAFADQFAQVGVFMGVLGIITGMIWANFTWGEPWSNDPKQNGAAIGLLIYFAYFILRGSLEDPQQKGRISAVYNIFAFALLIPLLFILPRLTDSLHPGNGGNPGFNAYDLDSQLRLVFYPAVIGWILLGVWLAQIKSRIAVIKRHRHNQELEAAAFTTK
ncbi:heme exporter protein C [Persicobacter psychrovividus]|uniref:Heme exporter protein C n=2 Tax=Persicobacter psychrovividus TaxID=387638 RepID=A0ABM7VGD4_9BACT|nr:heme exporter protein C [Persicobacter psychrovividus]